MNRESRFDKLESEIVEALRRAPGDEPSSEMDARIRARARATVRPARRGTQPRWMALAAGVMVLVGSGLALRIMQQVERAPGPAGAPLQSVPDTVRPTPTAADPAPIEELAAPEAPAASEVQEIDIAATAVPMPEKAAAQAPAQASQPSADRASDRGSGLRAHAEPFPATSPDMASGPAAAPISITPPPESVPLPPPPTVAGVEPEAAMEAPKMRQAEEAYARELPERSSSAEGRMPKAAEAAAPEPTPIVAGDDRGNVDSAYTAESDVQSDDLRRGETEAAEDAIAAYPPTDMDGAASSASTGVLAQPAAPGARARDSRLELPRPVSAQERVDPATADYDRRVALIRSALERGDRRSALRAARELERDYPDSILPPELRRQLAR